MVHIIRTNAENQDFIALVKLLDEDLAIRDGEDHAFYAQYNHIDKLKEVTVAYENDCAVGCGAIKAYDENTKEIKRMYVSPSDRGKGIAGLMLTELESWAKELGNNKCILETGVKQLEAIALYKSKGYHRVENFGQYATIEASYCFEKNL